MHERTKSDLKSLLYIAMFILVFVVAVGYDARWMSRCGVGTCFIGFVVNSEFKLW